MQSSNQPGKISVPFANSGAKQPIPVASQVGIEDGRASYTDGFPPLTRTPLSAGGKPPFGTDMNGILNAATVIQQWQSAGGGFKYDSTFATAIGGYPAGAMLVRSDNSGIWVNTVDNNSTDPEAGGAGWQPEGAGISTVSMSNANVTLTALQAAQPIILITGTLTANLNLILPAYTKQWAVVNSATGASFGVTVKTASGYGYKVMTGASATVVGDGTDIRGTVLATSQATESVSGIAKVATQALTNAGVDDATIVTPKKLFASQQPALNLKMNLTGDGATPRLGAVSVNSNGLLKTQQGAYLVWNEFGDGRTSLINNQGNGIGGFIFRNANKDFTIETGKVTIDGSGSLSSTGSIKAAEAVWAGPAALGTDGNITGSVYQGGDLKTHISLSIPQGIVNTGFDGYGSYAFLRYIGPTNVNIGTLVAGSLLRYASGDSESSGYMSIGPSGTWRCQGYVGTNPESYSTLWVKVG